MMDATSPTCTTACTRPGAGHSATCRRKRREQVRKEAVRRGHRLGEWKLAKSKRLMAYCTCAGCVASKSLDAFCVAYRGPEVQLGL